MIYNEKDIREFHKEHAIEIGLVYNKYIAACKSIGIDPPLKKIQIVPYYMTIYNRYASWREKVELLMEQEEHIVDDNPPLMFYVLHRNEKGCIILGALKINGKVRLSVTDLSPEVIRKLEN